MASRGSRTIRGLGRTFKAYDNDGNKKMSGQEFLQGLNDSGCSLTDEEAKALHEALDTDKDGTVNFDEFLVGIRGRLSPQRQEIVDQAFKKFDKDGSGFITKDDLKGVYNCDYHPQVVAGKKTPEQVFDTFLESFGDVNKDGKITKKEWDDYYAAVSASVDKDEHFIVLM